MSKELEALKIGIPKLKKLYENSAKKMNKNDILGFDLTFVYLEKSLQRLEAIDNTNPNEAFKIVNECLKGIDTYEEKTGRKNPPCYMSRETLNTIKQALLKAQEQEKVLEILKSKKYIPLDKINPRFWDNKKDYDEIVDYEFYLWLCEEECEYVVNEEQKLTQQEFDLLKRYFN